MAYLAVFVAFALRAAGDRFIIGRVLTPMKTVAVISMRRRTAGAQPLTNPGAATYPSVTTYPSGG